MLCVSDGLQSTTHCTQTVEAKHAVAGSNVDFGVAVVSQIWTVKTSGLQCAKSALLAVLLAEDSASQHGLNMPLVPTSSLPKFASSETSCLMSLQFGCIAANKQHCSCTASVAFYTAVHFYIGSALCLPESQCHDLAGIVKCLYVVLQCSLYMLVMQ